MRKILLCLAVGGLLASIAQADQATPDFGDDASTWAKDGECDDPRFAGPGMTNTPLLEQDRGHDATDCRQAWERGQLRLAGQSNSASAGEIDFGDDASTWANDGECDDPRFAGPGMTNTPLLEQDRGHDATDCRRAWERGQLRLAGQSNSASAGEIDFGDDTSTWANDGECDDPRFHGSAMASILLEADLGHDATDCRNAYRAGLIELR